ncbi:MAG: substrate-binding domain-containing protein [Phycisphaerales bacterium]|nr:substrate-binding domain-containing protein [Phycisphaerales bacterium]
MQRITFLNHYTFVLLVIMAIMGAVLPLSSQAQAQPSNTSAPVKKLRIGVSVPAADHGWTAGIGWWARRAMALHPNIEWRYATADKPEKQIADIEDMLARGVDGLVILATESAPLTPIAKKAHEQGVYIVNVDRGFLEPVADVFLEGDNRAFGRKSAEFIVQKTGGKANLVILRGIPSTVDTDRFEAAMEVFKAHPGIKVLAEQPGFWNRQKALEVMQNFLNKHKQIDVVWASDDDMALGAEQAIREARREKDMWIFPGAGMKDIVKKSDGQGPDVPGQYHLSALNDRDGYSHGSIQFERWQPPASQSVLSPAHRD